MIQLDPNDLWGLAAAVSAASDSGLVAAMTDGAPHTPASLAATLALHPAGVARVLDVLVAARVAEARGGEYTLARELVELHRAFPGGLALTTALFAATPGWLRTGASPFVMDGSTAERAQAYQATVGGLGRLFERPAAAFAEALDVSPATILDVGCGSGIWSLSVAARHPGARVTGLDLPPVLEVFAEAASARGLAVDRLPGDMHATALPEADLVILANVLRLEPAARAEGLVARLAAAVRPGGALVIVDALAEGTPDRDVARAVYALHLALRTRDAEVHPPARVRGWMEAAGLAVTPLDFGVWPGAVAAMVGRQ